MNRKSDSTIKTIVLVHGGFVDGSGWEEVYKILKKDGSSLIKDPPPGLEPIGLAGYVTDLLPILECAKLHACAAFA